MEQPKYVAKRTLWGAFTIWRILFFWLIIPTILMIVDAIKISKYSIEFYDGYVIERWGILSRHEKKTVFKSVLSVSIDQTLGGRMFNYGTLHVEAVGKWDVNLTAISDPHGLKEFLENNLANPETTQHAVID